MCSLCRVTRKTFLSFLPFLNNFAMHLKLLFHLFIGLLSNLQKFGFKALKHNLRGFPFPFILHPIDYFKPPPLTDWKSIQKITIQYTPLIFYYNIISLQLNLIYTVNFFRFLSQSFKKIVRHLTFVCIVRIYWGKNWHLMLDFLIGNWTNKKSLMGICVYCF